MTTMLSACRWNWCTQTFPNHSALRAHVESDHIVQATPVKRKDVPMLKCVEDGAGMPESFLSSISALAAGSDSSSQAVVLPHYIQRGIMTDPVASTGRLLDASLPSQAERPSPGHSFIPWINENRPLMKFAEMRGTPSPTPSLLPPSPGTGFLIRNINHNTVSPVISRQTPLATSLAHCNPQTTSPEPSQSAPMARDSTSYPTISYPAEGDRIDSSPNNAACAEGPTSQENVESQLMMITDDADDIHAVDINSIGFPASNSQWQPQSQLPLRESFEDSSSLPPATVPNYWDTDHVDEN